MNHPIPFAALDGKVGVMGITGSGKTFTAIGLVEQLLDAGRQVIVIDPTGAYNGLRTAYPIPIFGGRFGDVGIGEESGDAVSKAIIAHDLSAIVDVSLLLKDSHASARRFMAAFVARLKNAPARARYLVMDEADEFMPENAAGATARLFGDLKWIVRRGRIEGWRMLMVTQRPQDIAKSVLTQCETMVIHKLTAPQDRKALLEWVKGTADPDEAKEVLASMARLETGEAWVWSPRHGILERVSMPANRSEDRSKTPEADDAPRARLDFKEVDIEAIRATLAAVGDEAKPLNDLPATDNSGEILKLRARIAELEAERDEWIVDQGHGQQQLDALSDEVKALRSIIGEAWAGIQRVRPALEDGSLDAAKAGSEAVDNIESSIKAGARRSKARFSLSKREAATPTGAGLTSIPASQQRVLDAIAWWRAIGIEPVERNRASVIAGLSPKASTFGVYVSKLAQAGLVDTSTPGMVALTDAGRALATGPDAIDGSEVARQARSMLKPAAANVFDRILARYPHWIPRDQLADECGLSRTASTLGVYISESSKLGFVETRPGMVRIADWMMP